MPLPHDPGPHWGEVGIHGLHRQREWDEVGSAAAPGLPGETATLVALGDGRVLVEEGPAGLDPRPLAAALRLEPPFRVRAVYDEGSRTWTVGGRRIEVAELDGLDSGSFVELVWDGAERTLTVDGVESAGRAPELERIAAERFAAYVARARLLDGQLWELSVLPL
jgi:hypothetical protein